MNIIHYFIGLPAYRHGGAPKYAIDLLLEENKKHGIRTYIMTPGETLWSGNQSKINRVHDYNGIWHFEIQNPSISPLLYGVKSPEMIFNTDHDISDNELDEFYELIKPDLVHIHTLMGLPSKLLYYLRSKSVKIVLTSHDYYGICPRVNLVDRFGNVCSNSSGIFCKDCNITAKSKEQLRLLNSKFILKYKRFIAPLVLIAKNIKFHEDNVSTSVLKKQFDNNYLKLQEYYKSLFSLLDAIHFNSYVARSVYEQNIKIPYNEVIPITTNMISDRRRSKIFGNRIRMSYVSGPRSAKGFPLLKKVLIELKNEGYNDWELNLWYGGKIGPDVDCENIICRGRYKTSQLSDVYEKTDLLVVPSIWKETFSLVALEALSFGVPVLMSDNVGAQLLIDSIDSSFIYHDENELKSKLRSIFSDVSVLEKCNKQILESSNINFSECDHAEKMIEFYNRVISL